MTARPVAEEVWRRWPGGRPPARRAITLPLERVDPVIRIAHRVRGPGAIPERVIVDHELVLVLEGRAEVREAGGTTVVPAHHVLAVEPFVPHTFASPPGRPFEHVAVHFDLAPGAPPAGRGLAERRPYAVRLPRGAALPRVVSLTPGDGIEAGLIELVGRWRRGRPADRLAARGILLRVLGVLLGWEQPGSAGADVAVGPRSRARLERALAAMERGFATPLAVAGLARAAGLSPSRFTTLFREWTGYSPYEYLRRLRVERAATLLGDPRLRTREIALRTGFADEYHFSKAFRAVNGVPPSRYREALLAAGGFDKSSAALPFRPVRAGR